MNQFIETWKGTTKVLKEGYAALGKIFNIAEYAQKQLNIINDARPDKEKSLEENLQTEQQKEYIKYIKKVAETGNLECQY